MELLITLSSIFIITGCALLWNKIFPLRVCPICVGVSVTWLWMLVGVFLGKLPITNYQLLIAILMGGSVVGIAYQFERHILKNKEYQLLWKVLFIPIGFTAVYFAVSLNIMAIPIIIVLGILAFLFWYFPRLPSKILQSKTWEGERAGVSNTAKKLEKEMEQCC